VVPPHGKKQQQGADSDSYPESYWAAKRNLEKKSGLFDFITFFITDDAYDRCYLTENCLLYFQFTYDVFDIFPHCMRA